MIADAVLRDDVNDKAAIHGEQQRAKH